MKRQQFPLHLFTQGCVAPSGAAFPWAILFYPILGYLEPLFALEKKRFLLHFIGIAA